MIELRVYGDPAACRAAAEEGARVAKVVDDNAATLRRTTCDSWTGAAANGYRRQIADASAALADIGGRITPACRALEDFAGELEVVRNRMAEVRSIAGAAGLTVSGDVVYPPAGGEAEMSQAQVDAFNAKVRAYNEAFGVAEGARSKEREAHGRVTSAMTASNGDGIVQNLFERLGLLPPDGMDAVTGAGYMLGLGGLGFGGVAGWMQHGVLGVWQPKFRNAKGSWVWGTNNGWSRTQRLGLSLRPGAAKRDWRALPHQSASRGRWATASRWAGRAGGVVTGLTSGWSQWQADADDPTLDTGERVDRAATTAAATGLTAWGGATGGAWAGGAIGTAICPGVGTVVGGAIGGVVGGAIGAYAGSEFAEAVNEQWDGAVHALGDGLEAAGDGLSEVGDTLTFWD